MRRLFALLVLLIVGALFVPWRDVLPSAPREVEYRLDGIATGAALTLTNGTGGREQMDERIPYRRAFRAARGEYLYLSARLTTIGTVACKIIVDGEVVAEAAAEGRGRSATCSARAP